ncbi:DUF2516 family protein [Zhihengliuella flava]|uniref:Membrane protein n=1 Tax=Zhihengliuella flava TaxID=1285193 RepID=A0A931DD01_9MICC|nr:DUF2516 family protein [Zhihengliuella flava]MBG6085196.1 putative membrane protein [Zhihengliuella flava]
MLMGFAYMIENALYIGFAAVGFALALWALADALRHPSEAYLRHGKRSKGFWGGLTAGAAVFCFFGLFGGGAGLFQLVAVCVAAVYLADVRPTLSGRASGGYNF